jgi:3-oxoacyl-[acyl-carrier-protein] synthase-3
VLSNADLETMVDTNDEWITSRTGIKERRIAANGETCSDMSVQAAQRALEAAGLKATDLDLVICATVTGDYQFPSTSCLVQSKIGARKAAAFDLGAACSGFLYGLAMGGQHIASGNAKNVLLVGAEHLSSVVNYRDRSSCILFGDGAGAVVLSSEFDRGEVLSTTLHADGDRADVIKVPVGGSAEPCTHEALETGRNYMYIHGREVYKFAVAQFVRLVQNQLAAHSDLELGLVIPHQVNQRIIESARNRLEIPAEQVYTNIDRYGNTSAASIPIALDEVVRSGQMDSMQGKLIVFCAFGAGLTWASGSLRW